jgi:glycosidase
MTFPGAPVICYGDEIGLQGAERFSTNRSTMKWRKEEWNMEILDFFKKLVRIRKDHAALRTGCFRVVVKDAERGVFGFSRETAGDRVVAILNNSTEARDIAFPMEGAAGAKDLLSGRVHRAVGNDLRFSIPAKTGVVLCALNTI